MSKQAMQKAKIKYPYPFFYKSIECQFNPETLTISKSVTWNSPGGRGDQIPELNAPTLVFGGGSSATFKLELTFDTTEMGNSDVRMFTNSLLSLALKGGGSRSLWRQDPPKIRFEWGELILFVAVIESVSISYLLFLPNGIPVRARADVSFKQAFDGDAKLPWQNPTSRSEPQKTRIIQQGDRLDLLAYEEYGQASLWREIAAANQMDDPTSLTPGQILIIPTLD